MWTALFILAVVVLLAATATVGLYAVTRKRRTAVAAWVLMFLALVLALVSFVPLLPNGRPIPGSAPSAGPTVTVDPAVARVAVGFQFSTVPDGTVLVTATEAAGLGHIGRVATLTPGARTAQFVGPERTFQEPAATSAVVRTTTWVRIAPAAYTLGAERQPRFATWFLQQVGDTDPDVLAVAMQYVRGAPVERDERGVAFAGDAGFGYVHTPDERDGADFYDYLETPYTFPDGARVKPSKRWDRQLDCSGYLRLVYGYRLGIKLSNANGFTDGLPRSAYAIATYATARVITSGPAPASRPVNLDRLLPGDLVFFALHGPGLISHSGIYMGLDQRGGRRFISARQQADGPTFGDVGGPGVIDPGTYFGDRLRRAIRL